MPIQHRELLYIEWMDPVAPGGGKGWTELEVIIAQGKPAKCYSVGWHIPEAADKNSITLVPHFTEDEFTDGAITIDKKLVKKKKILRL